MSTIYNESAKPVTPLDTALDFVFHAKGGYVSQAEAEARGDRGGETNMGISRKTYPDEDITNMTKERAAELYRRDFWNPIRGDELPPAVALVAMDYAVNSGPGRVHRALRKIVKLPEKGGLTPQVMRRLRRMSEHDVARALLEDRVPWIVALSAEQPQHAQGWARRLRKLAHTAGRIVAKNAGGAKAPQEPTDESHLLHGGNGPGA